MTRIAATAIALVLAAGAAGAETAQQEMSESLDRIFASERSEAADRAADKARDGAFSRVFGRNVTFGAADTGPITNRRGTSPGIDQFGRAGNER